jgi:hypothetical protein
MLSRILIGLVLVAIGFLFVWKTRKIIETFGTSDWAETKIGGGGTSLLYKGIGLLVIFIGFMWATDLWNAFLEATLGPIFGPRG